MWPESLVAFALLYSAHTHKLCFLFTCYVCCFACVFIMWQSRWLPFVMFVVFLVCQSCGQSHWLPLPFYIQHTHTSSVCLFVMVFVLLFCLLRGQSGWLPCVCLLVMFIVWLVCLLCGQSRWLPLPFYIRHTHTSCVCSHRVLAIARGPSHFLVKDIFALNSTIVSSLFLTDDSFPHSRCQQHYPLLWFIGPGTGGQQKCHVLTYKSD